LVPKGNYQRCTLAHPVQGFAGIMAVHCLAYLRFSAPAVHASNLPIALQSVFEVAFLSMAWSWVVLALIVLVVTFGEARFGKPFTLICGFALLIQAVFTVAMVGFFIGNEMIGAASLLIISGCFCSTVRGSRPDSHEPGSYRSTANATTSNSND
jgi:hypothetical protein